MSKRRCENCSECQYLGEGDFMCMEHLVFILEDFAIPTEDYLFCKGKDFKGE